MPGPAASHLMPLSAPPALSAAWERGIHGLRGEERYRLRAIWCLLMVEDGTGELDWEGRTLPFAPGWAVVTAPDVELVYRFSGRVRLTSIHVVPDPSAELCALPVVFDLGARGETVRGLMAQAAARLVTAPTAARALAWSALTLVADAAGQAVRPTDAPTDAAVHPGVRKALAWAEARLERPLSAAVLAATAGLSVAQLNRAWRAATGLPAMGWVRERRLLRARHLLRHGGLGCGEVARRLCFTDLQHLNKALRRRFGGSPRDLRSGDGVAAPEPGEAFDAL